MRSFVLTARNNIFNGQIYNLNLNDELIPMKLKEDKRLRSIKLFFREGIFNIHSPQKLSKTILDQIVKNNIKLILNDWSLEKSKLSLQSQRGINGKEYYFRGRILILRLVISERTNIMIWSSLNELKAEIPKSYEFNSNHILIKDAINKWYKDESKNHLIQRLNYFAPKIGVKYNYVRFKKQRTRWGSCSSKGNINLNWLIIMAPDHVIDYVIIHELCHLKHMNHSLAFWTLVKQFHPNYLTSRQWLKEKGHSLSLSNS